MSSGGVSEPATLNADTPLAAEPPSECDSQPATTLTKGKAKDVCVWLPSSDSRPPPRPELPDSYFTATASEVQQAFSGQVAAREKLTDAPLLTKSLRERDDNTQRDAKQKKFPLARIRIRFQDRTMLEGVLPSLSNISDVYTFVKACLEESTQAESFIIYQTPPRTEYKPSDPKLRGKTLLDLQLAPSSIFYLKFLNESLNNIKSQPPLLATLLEEAKPLEPPPEIVPEMVSDKGSSSSSKPKGLNIGKALGGAKVPKWLKSGK